MIGIKHLVLTAAAGLALTACAPPAANNSTAYNTNMSNANANANANTAKPVAAAPTKEALMALDTSAHEAWKTKDTKFWDGFLSANFVGFGEAGRMDRAASIKQYSGADCYVKSYTLSDDQMMLLGADAAVLTYKVAIDGTCGGKKLPANSWASSVYVREGDKWKGAFHIEAPVIDPNAPPAKAAAPAPASSPAATSAQPDALATALMAVEVKSWDAWKNRDMKAMDTILAKEYTYTSGSGRYDRAGALKTWSEPKCENLAYTHSEPMAVSLSKDVGLVTYRADIKGTCNGKPNPPSIWAASVSVKEGDIWKNTFYTDVPR